MAYTVAQRILIKNGLVVNEDMTVSANVLIENGVIVSVDSSEPQADQIIDASGQYVMPGGIDPHTHLDMPFMGTVAVDDFESGHRAALAGGTTMHIDFVLPVDGSLLKGYEAWVAKAGRAKMDYAFHMAVTSWSERIRDEMTILAQEKGINSFKFFLAYKGSLMISDSDLIEALKHCKKLGALAQVHAENGEAVASGQEEVFAAGHIGPYGHAMSRPAILEEEATVRALALADFVNVPMYVVHVMSKGAMEAVGRARARGQRVVGEPTIAGLTLDESAMWHSDFDEAAKFVMSPPIRKRSIDGEALRQALRNDVLSIIATDHAVFSREQKRRGRDDFRLIPNGVNGIEERVPLAWHELVRTGTLTPEQFVRATSSAAAKVFGVYPRKGAIRPGSDADLYVLDPRARYTIRAASHHSAVDQNVFEGWELEGRVRTTVSRGKVVFHDFGFTQSFAEARGDYVPTPLFNPYWYQGVDAADRSRTAGWMASSQKELAAAAKCTAH